MRKRGGTLPEKDEVQTMKKVLCVLLSAGLLLSATACRTGDKPGSSGDTGSAPAESRQTVSQEAHAEFPGKTAPDDITWYTADLKAALRLASRYVSGMLDKDLDYEPYFAIHGQGAGVPVVGIHALEIGIPHVTGRALDCLFNAETVTGERMDSFAEETYRRYFYSCMENDAYLPVYYKDGKPYVEMHNLREACEGIAWLVRGRDDERAKRIADGFLTTLTKVTNNAQGYFTESKIKEAGLQEFFKGIGNGTGTTGRLVGALLNLYDATGDERAFKLAGNMTKGALACFGRNGEMSYEAGTHIHSITSTLSGVLEYGYMAGDRKTVDKVMKIYKSEEGLQQVMYSTGWIKEQIRVAGQVQGECNQIGDVIEMQLLFGANEPDASYWYGQAEKFMRSALLPSQVLRNNFFKVMENPTADKYDMKDRAIGGFGFPMPASHLQHGGSALNTVDITQGSVQAISYFTKHIAVEKDGAAQVNLFFDWENDVAKVESLLPLEGKVQITPKKDGKLRIRIPEAIEEGTYHLFVNGSSAAYTQDNGYAVLDGVKAGDKVYVRFTPKSVHYSELFYKGTAEETTYEIYMFGEQTVAVAPIRGIYPLYENWPLDIPGLGG